MSRLGQPSGLGFHVKYLLTLDRYLGSLKTGNAEFPTKVWYITVSYGFRDEG